MLVLGLGITLLTWRIYMAQAHDHSQQRFEARANEVHAAINTRLGGYVQILRGIQAYVGSIGHPNRTDWARLLGSLRIYESSPGISGATYVRTYAYAEREATLAAIRRFEPEFAIRPPGDRPYYATVTSVEPRTPSNLPAIGTDHWTKPERRWALDGARESGEARITGKVALTSDDPSKPIPTFVMYQPIYRHGILPETVAERNAALVGYIAIGFRIEALMKDALGATSREVAMRVYDGTTTDEKTLFHVSHPNFDFAGAAHTRQMKFLIGGRDWTAVFASLPTHEEAQETTLSRMILLGGGGINLLLFSVVYSLSRTRSRAEALATEMTHSLREREATLRELFAQAPVGIVMIAPDGSVIDCNDKFAEYSGAPRQTIVGFNIIREAKDRALIAPLERALNGEAVRIETDYTSTVGKRTAFYQYYFQPVSIDDKLAFVLAFNEDISVRREAEARIEHLAHHDTLTGLANRALLKDRLEHAIANARRGESFPALLFLDLDHFKNINDGLGHSVGDALLVEIGARLHECVRESDTLARIGGDEFVILLGNCATAPDAARVAEKLLTAVARPLSIEGHALGITASVGIAIWPGDGLDPETLTRNADAALYHAKNRGRANYKFFTVDLNAHAVEALAMETALRSALARDEFCLHFQPQIDCRDGRIIGVEALVRWQHPELGQVPPAKFIPIAEERGLIDQVGEWVIHEACRRARAWQNAGFPAVPVAVNISPLQFVKKGALRDCIVDALQESGLDPRYLALEITESALMHDIDAAVLVLRDLRALGVTIEVDDFGTGYSSLSYLKQLPIHRLKVDQSFVRGTPDDPDDVAIIGAILSMARSLKLDIIAEGVETQPQRDFLAGQGCHAMQGYLYARPVADEEFARILARGHISLP